MFDLGDTVPLQFQVRDASGTLANATAVTLTVTQPDQTSAGPFTLTPTTAGVYDYDFLPTLAGRHVARCVATGSNACSFTDAFDVAEGDAGGIISLADAKAQFRITQSTNDEELRLYLAATTALIEHVTGPVLSGSHTEIVDADETIILAKAPVLSITSIAPTLTYLGWAFVMPTWTLDGPSGILRAQPTVLSDFGSCWQLPAGLRLSITYIAGRQIIPAPLQVAARIILEHLWESRRLAGPKPATSADELVQYGRDTIPEAAKELLTPYRRTRL